MRTLCFKPVRSTVAVLILCLTSAGTVQADDFAVYHKALHSTGWIYVHGRGSGTGWVVDRRERLVVTNYHVVGDHEFGGVIFPIFRADRLVTSASEYMSVWNTKAIRGTVIYRDVKRDLALLRLENLPEDVIALPLAAHSVGKGEHVLAIGNSGLSQKPLLDAQLWTLRIGDVLSKSFRHVTPNNTKQNVLSSMINTTLDSRPGDSGGPVVNTNGELVAVTSAGNSVTSLAIDVSEVRAFLYKALASPRQRLIDDKLAGSWTISWTDTTGNRNLAGLTLRADGTCVWEDHQTYEGIYRFENGRLTLNLRAMRLQITVEVNVDGDRVQFTGDRFQYTMERR